MATLRQRRYNYLKKNGFFPSEARELSRTSRAGMLSPYFQTMVRSRRRLFDNAKRYNWTEQRYRDYVKKLYTNKDFVKEDAIGRRRVDVWAMLRYYEELSRRRGEEYESPWVKRTQRKGEIKRELKRVTKKGMLKSWIIQIDKRISRTRSEYKRQQFEKQKANMENQLKDMSK